MPNVQAFRALRYNLGHVGELGAVISPAPDQIADEQIKAIYQQHPCNFVRLIANRTEPGDVDGDQNQRAIRYFRNWKREGVFERDGEAAIYVVEIKDLSNNVDTALGLFAIADIDSLPTLDNERNPAERDLELLSGCEANLNPLVMLVEDLIMDLQTMLLRQVANKAPIQAEMDGFQYSIWVETDLHFISLLTELIAQMQTKPIGNSEALIAAREYQNRKSPDDSNRSSDSILTCFLCLNELRLEELGSAMKSQANQRYFGFADGLVRFPLIPSGAVVHLFD